MIPHSYPSPPRLVASGGPVSRAVAIMVAADPQHPNVRSFRIALATRIEADIALLDALAGDADFEPGADDEPSLGSPNIDLVEIQVGRVNPRHTKRLPAEPFAVGSADDREHDAADGPEGDDEREGVHGSSNGTDDDEPSLCGVTVNAASITGPNGSWDGEMSLGSLGGTAADCEGSQVDCSRGDHTDKEVDTGSRTHRQPREDDWNPSPKVRQVREDLRRRREAKLLARRGASNVRLIGIR